MCGHGEGKAHIHAAAVTLHWGIKKLLHLGKGDDLVKLSFDLGLAHTQNGAIQVDVLASGEFRVKAGANFEEATNASMNLRPSGGRFCNAREDFQEGSLAGAIEADEAERSEERRV